MDRDIKEFIFLRCERALVDDEEYMKAEMSGKVAQDELQHRAEALCYLKGFRDMLQFMGVKCKPEDLIKVAMVAKNGSHIEG